MKLPKIRRNFASLSDAQFTTLGHNVIEGLTNNRFFPEIGDALADFKEVFDTFVNSIPSRSERNSINSAAKNVNKTAAVNSLFLLSHLVEYQARFNIEALETTNFGLVKQPKPKGLVGMVKNIELRTNGVEGMVIVQCTADTNATIYNARVSTDEENWKWFKASNSRTIKITNLPLGEKLYVQMQLENTHGQSPWSASVTGVISTSEVIMSIHE